MFSFALEVGDWVTEAEAEAEAEEEGAPIANASASEAAESAPRRRVLLVQRQRGALISPHLPVSPRLSRGVRRLSLTASPPTASRTPPAGVEARGGLVETGAAPARTGGRRGG